MKITAVAIAGILLFLLALVLIGVAGMMMGSGGMGMPGMMSGYGGSGMMSGGMMGYGVGSILSLVFWALIIGGIVFLAVRLAHNVNHGGRPVGGSGEPRWMS